MNETANDLFTKIWKRTNARFDEIFLIRKYSYLNKELITHSSDTESNELVSKIAITSVAIRFFTGQEPWSSKSENLDRISQLGTQKEHNTYQTVIDRISIILAYSALEAATLDYFRVIEMVATPHDMEIFITHRSVPGGTKKEFNAEENRNNEFKQFIRSLNNMPLVDKIANLYQITADAPLGIGKRCGEPLTFNKAEIEPLERLNQQIRHGETIEMPTEGLDDWLFRLEHLASFFMVIVSEKFFVKLV